MIKHSVEDIIDKYPDAYKAAEMAVMEATRAYEKGKQDILAFYTDNSLTGVEVAKLLAQYITQATITIINGTIQASLGLLQQGYTVPMQEESIESDIEYKTAQTEVLRNSECYNALLKMSSSNNDMMGSMGAGGIVAPSSMIAVSRECSYKLMEILKDPKTGTQLFDTSVITYLNKLVDKNNPVATPDVMTQEQNNINKD